MPTKLPEELFDPHHHFIDTDGNSFQSFLKSCAGSLLYTPEEYEKDVKDSLASVGVKLSGSVHVEAMPDDGAEESAWVQDLITSGRCTTVKAIVGSVDLASPNAATDMAKLKSSSPLVRGVRWILDCAGPFDDGKTATHVATKRHDGIDYLRGGREDGTIGGYDGSIVPAFEAGFAKLADHELSFDLQCAPSQLLKAAELFKKYPNIPVVIDHLGKPRMVLGEDDPNNKNTIPDAEEIRVWRAGMKAMAALPHVFVKISMLGYAIPGWIRTSEREAVMKGLVRETIELFGPQRCMVATNWWANAAMSDADGLSKVGPDAVCLCEKFVSFFDGYSNVDLQRLFSGTAKCFYRISSSGDLEKWP
uniref:Amidohydrolase-related domain-containing protein n=1 Tax=Ditylum brightwellii TaxID=49249 RepID=A0A6U3RVF6_9STRA|mmetsp:Transcript_30897/g.46073  ORF Transcript_30897/g.46073 Transcript_30897/m.46073 type:complete len:362 (+) Transcript_30897:156-1241(+)